MLHGRDGDLDFMGQEPAEAFFGLGAATTVDRVTIEWPDGLQSVLDDVAADQQLVVFPAPSLFTDGFASGALSAWSVALP